MAIRDDPMTLRWSQGEPNCADAFLPHDDPLVAGESRHFLAHGGRSSNGSGGGELPFFNVHANQKTTTLSSHQ